ncbi:hypothetical protein HK099_002350, partial [Clydaea vesicula]
NESTSQQTAILTKKLNTVISNQLVQGIVLKKLEQQLMMPCRNYCEELSKFYVKGAI